METEKYTNTIHLGRKIERVRRLRGMTQAELGDLLGITKQAVSKIEQTEKFDDERLGEIASALGVTVDGLKSFNEETILYNTNNFYENCGVKSAVSNTGNNQTFNSFPVEQVIEIFEKLLDKQKEQFETLKKREEINISKILNFISSSYIPDTMIAELISSKNKEIDWLKEEIKFLRGENEKLLLIVGEKI